jgi:hypothetical protein
MKTVKLVIICVLLEIFIFIKPNTCISNSNNELEDIAKNALLEKYSEYLNTELKIRIEKENFLTNELSIVNIVALLGEDNTPRFFVIIDKNRCTYLFSGSIESNVDEFNRLVVNNKIQISEKNFNEFIKYFLIFVNDGSKIISSYNDFDSDKDFMIKYLKKKIGPITSPSFKNKKNEFISEFYSWDLHYVTKWEISFSHEGKIITYKYKDLFTMG